MDISIIIPVYNEADSLRELAAWILKVVIKERYDYEVIMIDDGSTDDSLRVMGDICRKNPRFKIISFQRNYGKSAALQTGFQAAQGKVVITMDADLQDSPDEIPELHKMIRSSRYDMISGWKKKRHDPIHKRLPSKLYNATVRMVSGIKLHDFNCGLKAYSKEVVKSIEVYGEMHRYIPVIAKWAGFKKIGEKVIKHYPRKFGKSKFGMERYAKGYLDLLTISFISRYGRRPMHLFGLLGSFIFLVGFAIAGYLAYEKWVNQAYMMTSRPLFFFGLLAMILGTILFVGGFLGELICRNNPDRNRYLIRNDAEKYEKATKGNHPQRHNFNPNPHPQPRPQPQQNPQPQHRPQSQPNPQPQPRPQPQQNPQPQPSPQPQQNSQSQPRPQPQPNPQPQPQQSPQPQSQQNPQHQQNTQSKSKTKAQSKSKQNPQPEPQPQPQPQPQPNTQSKPKTKAQSKSKQNPQPEEPQSQPNTQSKSKTKAQSKSKQNPQPDPLPQPNPQPKSKSKSKTKSQPNS